MVVLIWWLLYSWNLRLEGYTEGSMPIFMCFSFIVLLAAVFPGKVFDWSWADKRQIRVNAMGWLSKILKVGSGDKITGRNYQTELEEDPNSRLPSTSEVMGTLLTIISFWANNIGWRGERSIPRKGVETSSYSPKRTISISSGLIFNVETPEFRWIFYLITSPF